MRDFFEEIAKHRAARRLWARIMRERFEAQDPRSWTLRLFSGGDGTSLTSVEPLNNVVRTTLQTLAIVLSGAQAVHTMAWDEALALPTEEAALIALRTRQIVAYESGVARTVDPLGGSYFLESLTDELDSGRTRSSTRSSATASSRRSRTARSSARSPTPPTASSARSSPATGSSSA